MDFRRKYIFWVIVIIFSINIINGQSLTGIVKNTEDESLIGASVVVKEFDNNDILAYDIVDDKGKWQIEFPNLNGKKLIFNYLGYEELIIEVTDSIKQLEIFTVIMHVKQNYLDEVVVSGKSPLVIIRNDTTIYSVEGYIAPTDKTLGDVLDKLPGLEVTNEGQIEFNGKRIDKLLIEGKDILNNQHKLVTEGIKSEDLKRIQIIENFKNFNEINSNKWSDKVALNIQLTDDAKSKTQKEIEVSVGHKMVYEAAGSVYKVNNKFGSVNFLRSNNLGEPVISLSDFIALKSSLIRTVNSTDGDLNSIIPKGFNAPIDAQTNNQSIITSNNEIQFNKRVALKLSILGSLFDRKSGSIVNRTYLNTNSKLDLLKETNTSFSYVSTDIDLKIDLSKKSKLELDFPFTYSMLNENHCVTGSIEHDSIGSNSIEKQGINNVFPQIFWSYRQNENLSFNLETGLSNGGDRNNLSIISERDLFDSESGIINQNHSTKKNNPYFRFSFQHNFRDLVLGGDFSVIKNNERTDLEQSPMLNQKGYRDLSYILQEPLLYFGYRSNKFLFQPEFKIKRYLFKNDDTKYSRVLPSLVFRYSFSRLHFILLRYSQDKEIEYNSMIEDLYIIKDSHTIFNNEISKYQVVRKDALSLSYMRLNLYKKLRLFCQLAYFKLENPIVFINEIKNNYILESLRVYQYNKGLKFLASVNKRYYGEKLILRGSLRHNTLIYKEIERSKISLINNSAKLNIKTNFKQNFNYSISYFLSENHQNLQNKNNYYISQSGGFGIAYSKNKTNAEIELRASRNSSSLYDPVLFPYLGINLECQIYKQLSLFVRGRDLFNFNQQLISQTKFNNIFFETMQFQRFAGSIAVGIKWGD